MSDSETDSVGPGPSDASIEQTLRRVVGKARASGDDVTVNNARAQAERELNLAEGFFRDSARWKSKSKEIISDAFEAPIAAEKPTKSAIPLTSGTKRKSDASSTAKTQKRQRKSLEHELDDGSGDPGDAGTAATPSKAPPKKSPAKATKSAEGKPSKAPPSSTDDDDSRVRPEAATNGDSAEHAAGDESDYSSVIDEAPPKKKRAKKSASPGPAKSEAKTKSETPSTTLTADEEEIKRLQSWLLKCGVRKLWHRELAPYNSSKDKIRHLKSMLDEVGMTGRFSVEKARGIKEARELAAEIEAAKEFNEQWGDGAEEEQDGTDDGKAEQKDRLSRRARPKGLVDFGDSDDDSE